MAARPRSGCCPRKATAERSGGCPFRMRGVRGYRLLYYIILYYTVHSILYYAILHYTPPYYSVLYSYTELHCIVTRIYDTIHYPVLYRTTPCHTIRLRLLHLRVRESGPE